MSYQYGAPPPSDPQQGLPRGWVAKWDPQSQHWFYVDESSGRTQWERPQSGGQQYAPPPQPYGDRGNQYGGPQGNQYGGPQGQYGGGQYGGGQQGGQYGGAGQMDDRGYHKDWSNYTDQYAHNPSQSNVAPPSQPKKNWGGIALGAGAGVLGGLFVAHEAENVKDDFERDKYDVENDYDRAKYDVEDAPDRLAGWAGNKVGDAEYDVDRVKDDVEDAPEDVAGWAGQKVGNVEGDFDRVDNAYDDSRDDARGYDDQDY